MEGFGDGGFEGVGCICNWFAFSVLTVFFSIAVLPPSVQRAHIKIAAVTEYVWPHILCS